MKIIKEGKRKTWGLELLCTGKGNSEEAGCCGATLLVEADDVFLTSALNDKEQYYTFECFFCECWTDIPKNILPESVKKKARKKIPKIIYDRNKEINKNEEP